MATLKDAVRPGGGGGGNDGTVAKRAKETAAQKNMSTQQLATEHRSHIDAQDDRLEGILNGVSTLKAMSHDMSAELDLHGALLSDLDNDVDVVDARVKSNTRKVEEVTRKERGCCFFIIILFLLAVIVLLSVTNYACHIFNSKKCHHDD
jgi:hypothetical protein